MRVYISCLGYSTDWWAAGIQEFYHVCTIVKDWRPLDYILVNIFNIRNEMSQEILSQHWRAYFFGNIAQMVRYCTKGRDASIFHCTYFQWKVNISSIFIFNWKYFVYRDCARLVFALGDITFSCLLLKIYCISELGLKN